MKASLKFWIAFTLLATGCIQIPQETITLSRTLGKDLETLHTAHTNTVTIHFDRIERQINEFVDEVYKPYVVHFVLEAELKSYKSGEPSIFGAIETAGKVRGVQETNLALSEMSDFLTAAQEQIDKKRKELLDPVQQQKADVLAAVNQSYQNVIYANSTITGHLESIKKVRDAQKEALSIVGLGKADSIVSKSLISASAKIEDAIRAGQKIDVQSDDALKQLDQVSTQIKAAFNRK